MERPERNEYGDYYHLYVSRVPDGDLLDILADHGAALAALLSGVGEKQGQGRKQEFHGWSPVSCCDPAGHGRQD